MTFIRAAFSTSIALAFVIGYTPASAEEYVTTLDALQLSENVWHLRPDAPAGNPSIIAVLDENKALLIDAGTPESAPLVRRWLSDHGVSKVSFIAYSHYHTDHVWGAESFTADGPVIIGTREQSVRLSSTGLTGPESSKLNKSALPTVEVEEEKTVLFGEERIRLFRLQDRTSHTDGDLFASLERAHVIYVGDHYFAGKFPIIDTEGGGNLWGYLRNIDRLIAMADGQTVFIAGHGAFSPAPIATYSKLDFEAWRDRLVATIEFIRARKAQHKTKEEIIAEGLPAEFKAMGEKPRFVKEPAWIETVWNALD